MSLASSSTASSTSLSVSPDVAALSVIVVLMAVTAIGSILSLLYLNSRPWANSKHSAAAPLSLPAYKQQALKEGLQLLELPKDRKLGAGSPGRRRAFSCCPMAAQLQWQALRCQRTSQQRSRCVTAPQLRSPSQLPPGHPQCLTRCSRCSSPARPPSAPELEDGTNDIYLHEMSTAQHSSLDGFDLSTATGILADTRQAFTSFFASQSAAFSSFTEAVQLQLEHLKQLLSVKLSVTLSRQNLSFAEAIDRHHRSRSSWPARRPRTSTGAWRRSCPRTWSSW